MTVTHRLLQQIALGAFTLMLTAMSSLQASSPSCNIKSSASGATLIELFTSEGCSSCPPADAWQNNLKNHTHLWTKVVPVSFHVDYWDYLGWRDKLAQKSHVKRQRQYQLKGHSRSVYTPGFFVNGREWRGFFGSRKYPNNNPVAQGKLVVAIKSDSVNVLYNNALLKGKPKILTVTLLGFDIAHKVRSGENRGRTLKHDFVVLKYLRLGATSGDSWNIPLTLNSKYLGHRVKAIAVWTSTDKDPRPLQVAAGWIKTNCL
ncbi:hypothetical protein that often co-occurs with aconitase [hydrothermal vent metagenome]|uniref:DUF1223 domain-containing protein n=1 Tax=hydrothermal vent metagenome TaxID=652676 RepID=A0A3B0YE21_9ZZZZ